MKNLSLIRRFILGSMVLGLVVPMVYHITLNISRSNHFGRLTSQVCKAIEPRIQIGAQREALEYLKSTVSNQGENAFPEIEFKDHGNLITPPVQKTASMAKESCNFQGISGVEVSVYYQNVPLLNISYLYLYLLSVPVLFLIFMWVRRGVIRLQRKVADLIEKQMKQLLGMGSVSEPEKASLLYKLFDLEIPLLKYLKGHIESLETDLQTYSQKIAEQQKREVLMDVAAQMAHDIVTPISNLQTILASDEQKSHQDLILSELGQIKSLSEKLLRQYRGESSNSRQSEVIDIVACTSAAIESVRLFAEKIKPVEFKFEFDPIVKVSFNGDRTEFIAALSNILRNSVEALDKKLGQIAVRLKIEGSSLKLSISDNGCGIKKGDLERIFENKVSIGKSNGTGIGLYQVKSMIEGMNGSVDVESVVGTGTTMKLCWPLSEIILENANPRISDENLIGDKKLDLILIDDSRANRTSWSIQAKKAQKNLAAFSSWDEFAKTANQIEKTTPVFVDYTFVDSHLSGKDVSERIMAEGFQNVYITTGLPPEYVTRPNGVKSVLGKDFPSLGFI